MDLIIILLVYGVVAFFSFKIIDFYLILKIKKEQRINKLKISLKNRYCLSKIMEERI